MRLIYCKNGLLRQRVAPFFLTGPVKGLGYKATKIGSILVPIGSCLVRDAPVRNLTQITRGYSTKPPDSSAALERDSFMSKTQSAFDIVLKASQETNARTSSLSDKSKDFLKTFRPSSNEETSQDDWIQKFIKKNPKNIDPNQLLDAFVKRLNLKEPNLVAFNRLIHAFSLDGEFKRAQSIFDLMLSKGVKPNKITYHTLMNAYSNGGKLTKTIEIFELIRKDPKNQSHFPYAILIKAYTKHNRVQDAFDVIALMKQKMIPNVHVYCSLIQACIKARDNNRAWEAYEMMLKDGVLPNIVTYTMLISICQKTDVKKALELFEELLNQKIAPNQKTVRSLLAVLCSAPGYYSKAIELLSDLTTQDILKPDDFLFTIMINGAAVNKNLPDARRFFFRLQGIKCEPKAQIISFSTMFKAYATAFPGDKTERVIKLLASNEMSDFSFLKSHSPRGIKECVVEAMTLIHVFEKRYKLKESIHDCSLLWAAYLSVLTNYNYFNEAMKWFKIISEKNNHRSHSLVYSSMLDMCRRLNKEAAFFEILEKAEAFLAPIGPKSTLTKREKVGFMHSNLLSSVLLERVYEQFIIGLTNFGRITEAMDHFEIMNQDSTIKWNRKLNFYKPFFKAIKDSSDSDLKKRLKKFV